MSLLCKGNYYCGNFLQRGISKLSQLTIDADKDWGSRGLSNIKELAPGMKAGDMLIKGAAGLIKIISPSSPGDELTANGPGAEIAWKAPLAQ